MKAQEKLEARRLRKEEGSSIKTIATLLGVSKGSVSLWVRDIVLEADQIKKLNENNPIYNKQLRGADARKKHALHRRRKFQENGKERASGQKSNLHQALCMLYWAEGEKARNTLGISNSDVNLLRYFIDAVESVFGVDRLCFTLKINCYTNSELDLDTIESFWVHSLGLNKSCCRKHTVNSLPTSSSGEKRGKLPYGTATIRLYNSKLVQHIYGAIQWYAGFENENWVS